MGKALTQKGFKNSDGFTLVELILVVAIVAVLSSVAIPVLSGLVKKADASVCIYNRATVSRSYTYQKTLDQSLSLDEYLTKSNNNKDAVCPSDGLFTVADDGTTILCSVHGESSDSGEKQYANTKTNFYLKDVNGNTLKFSSDGDLEAINADFFNKNPKGKLTYKAGEIFYFQGSYYVWKRETTFYASSEFPQMVNWYAAEVDMNNEIGYLDVSTGTIVSGEKVTKGSMYYIDIEGNGTYVLAYNRGESHMKTGDKLNSWYIGPDAKHLWIVFDEEQGVPAS